MKQFITLILLLSPLTHVHAQENTGIGTKTPEKKLTVQSTDNDEGVFIESPDPSIWLKDSDTDDKTWRIKYDHAEEGLSFIAENINPLISNLTTLFIKHNSGYVGIGTTAPDQLLTLESPVNDKGILIDTPRPSIWLRDYSTADKTWRIRSMGSEDGLFFSSQNDDGTNDNTRVYIEHSSGFVGVNTASPTQELDINGDLRVRGQIFDSGNSQGSSGQVLMKNSSNNTKWTSSAIFGNIGSHNASHDDIGKPFYTGTSISLPPGQWIVHIGLTIEFDWAENRPFGCSSCDEPRSVFMIFSLSDNGATVGENNTFPGSARALRPTQFAEAINYPSTFDFIQGIIRIDNNSNNSRTYHLWQKSANGSNMKSQDDIVSGLGSDSYTENYIYATPYN